MSSEEEAFATLQAEARRRGVSLNTVLAEAVEEKADAIRRARRQPRTGVGASTDGRSAAQVSSTPAAHPPA
jgi:hypothetical protein